MGPGPIIANKDDCIPSQSWSGTWRTRGPPFAFEWIGARSTHVDQTALPAAATILRELPRTTHVTVIAEIDNDAEQRELPSDADVTWIWLPRNDRPAGGSAVFLAALEAFDTPTGRGAAYAGAEAATVRSIRRYLKEILGLEPEQIVTRGYWKRGASNHPDGDYATD